MGVVSRKRRKLVCSARVLTPATPVRSASAIASRACSSMNCSTRRTKKGAVVWPAASIARVLSCGIDARRREVCDKRVGEVRRLVPEVVAFRLTVAKIEMTLAREVGDGVFAAESDVHVSPPVLQIAGAE